MTALWREIQLGKRDKVGTGEYANGKNWTWTVIGDPKGRYKAARDAVEPDSSSWEYGLYAYTITDKEPEHLFDTGTEAVVIYVMGAMNTKFLQDQAQELELLGMPKRLRTHAEVVMWARGNGVAVP